MWGICRAPDGFSRVFTSTLQIWYFSFPFDLEVAVESGMGTDAGC